MKPLWRILVLALTLLSLQRLFLYIAVPPVVLAHLAYLFHAIGFAPLIAIVAIGTGVAIVTVIIGDPAGWYAVAAPRSLRLIPYARLYLLLAAMISAAILAAFVTLNIWLLQFETHSFHTLPLLAGVSPGAVFADALALASASILWSFMAQQRPWLSALPTLLTISMIERWKLSAWSLVIWRDPELMTGVIAVVWGLFACWYFRVAQFRRVTRTASGRGQSTPQHIALDRKSAVQIHLFGGPLTFRVPWKATSGIVLSFLAVYVMAREPDGTLTQGPGGMLILLLGFMVSVMAFALANVLSQRARLLWLRGACSREQLFTLSERLLWSGVATIAVPALALGVAVWWLLPEAIEHNWPYMLLASALPTICALYLGLTRTQTARLGGAYWVACVSVFVIGWGCAARIILSSGPIVPIALTSALIQVLYVVTLRGLAQRRWREIDWLACKTPARGL